MLHVERDERGCFLLKIFLGLHNVLKGQPCFLHLSSVSTAPIHNHLLILPRIHLTTGYFHHHNNGFLRILQCSLLAGRVPLFQTGLRGCPGYMDTYRSSPVCHAHISLKNGPSPTTLIRHRSTCFSCSAPTRMRVLCVDWLWCSGSLSISGAGWRR